MVAGESGLGKSTLVNSLFLTDLYKDRKLLNAEERIVQTVEITKHVVDIEEKGVKLRLTIVDTPGFGDAVNNTECWKPVADYIDQQFEQYFRDESGLNRKNIQDNRVHCCLYFISPFGHGYELNQPIHEPGTCFSLKDSYQFVWVFLPSPFNLMLSNMQPLVLQPGSYI
uniref:Septin-type G domain-containing protein n=1 Tax=Naja naja TaxID=35670 RepID=A0A8C6X128_NAJNA